MKLLIEPISVKAFSPYGTVVRAPENVGRTIFPNTLLSKRIDATPTLSASRALPKTLPLTCTVMERHRFSSQTFFPLDVSRYVVVVAPAVAEGMPDMRRACALIVPGDTAITYAADCWHHPMIALDQPACFSVLMWRDGTTADIETVTLAEPFELAEI